LAKNVGLLEKIREEEDKFWVVFEKDPELGLERQRDLERGGFWALEILHWVVKEEQRATSVVEEEVAIVLEMRAAKSSLLLCCFLFSFEAGRLNRLILSVYISIINIPLIFLSFSMFSIYLFIYFKFMNL